MDWRKPFRKNPIQQFKNSRNQSEIAACEQKAASEKVNICAKTFFSLYFKITAKISRCKTTLFSLHFSAPQNSSNSLNFKKLGAL